MKPVVILLHGFALDSAMWDPQRRALAGMGYRVIAPDFPGFGSRAPWPREACSMDSFADDVYSLIVREASGSAVVAGLSMGGYILLSLLRRHSDVIQAAMLVDTQPAADTPQSREYRMAMVKAVEREGNEAMVAAMLPRLLSDSASDELKKYLTDMVRRQSPQGIIAAQLAMAARRDQTDLLSQLHVPVLIIVGAEDVITPPSIAADMKAKIPSARLVEIPGAGHMSNLQSPERVSEAMLEFLNSLSPQQNDD
ncbi:MAG TPA: alpha/beta fold hydrolase [Phycisphaerae bacterium]|nr:alpha/beta fold hydrolase [Phycisphaerae bacterium]